VDHAVGDRRHDARFAQPRLGTTRATLRPGCAVVLVDVSAGGALVEAARPLRPGARVYFQLVTENRTFVLAASVLRCAVWALDPNAGVTYRGALKFEHRCELCWEHATLTGFTVPAGSKSAPGEPGKGLPAVAEAMSAVARRSVK
jgi:hypothetical protein